MTPLARTVKYSYKRLRLISRPVIALPLGVFIVFVIVSAIAYGSAQSSLATTRDRIIERRVQENSVGLSNRLSAYTLIAAGGAGYATTNDVTADGWRAFVSAYNIGNNFPSINAVTYARAMSKDDAQAYVDQRNADVGSQEFSLDPRRPIGDPYILTMYAVPDSPAFKSLIGIDEYSNSSRKEAIDRAIESDRPALTSKPQLIKPVDNPNGAPQLGFIIFAPIYNKNMPRGTAVERKAALLGTSNVSFRAAPFFDGIYADSDKVSKTYLTVYQGSTDQSPKIYEGGVVPAKNDVVNYKQKIEYAGQTFTYVYEFSDSDLLTDVELHRPSSMLIIGIALGGMLAILMLFSIRGRLHKLSSDKEHEIQMAKDALLSLASHQLRTPATGVKQYMGMVLQGFAGDITPQQTEFLQKAYESNERQLHVINDILHMAKLDAGRIVLSKTIFNMSELIGSVLEEQKDSADDAQVTITSTVPKKSQVYADSHMMRMVVENLVTNAIKYTYPGGRVRLTFKMLDDTYELSVKDTGVGIAESDLDKLFKQFSRVANERSHLVSGTGVGLYLVKNLVELHGGEINVSSKLSKGTIFTVTFPKETLAL